MVSPPDPLSKFLTVMERRARGRPGRHPGSDDIVDARAAAMNLGSFKKILRERGLRLPLWFHVVVTLTAVGIPLYQWVTFSGFFRLWAESWKRAHGTSDKKFIFVMLVCAFMLAGAIVTQGLATFVPPPSDEKLAARAAAFTSYDNFGVWMRRHSFKLTMVAVAIAAVAVGVYALVKS